MRLSVVTTLYRSAPHLEQFYTRAALAAGRVTADYEIVLVNDGSPDDSLAVALELQQRDPRIRILDLSRNFGHHVALWTGLRHANGDLIFMLDSDLEEDPGWLVEFHEVGGRTGADVVYGVQRRRKGSLFERVTGWLFYDVCAKPLGVPIPRNAVTARLMTRRYVDAVLQYEERESSILALCTAAGFDQRAVPVTKGSRGASTYSVRRRISTLVNAVTSFSNRPLVLIFYLGSIIMLASLGAAGLLIWERLMGRVGVPGYASLLVSVWFLGGLAIFCVGVVGIYVSRVFIEVKRRPLAIVRAEYPPRTGARAAGRLIH